MLRIFTVLLFSALLLFACNDYGTNANNEEPNENENPNEVEDGDLELVYFFYFNGDMPNNTPLTEYEAWFQADAEGWIRFESALEGYPFDSSHENWRQASMERRNQPTAINYRPEGNEGNEYVEGEMRAMQVRNPFRDANRENTLILDVPTIGYSRPVLSLAAMNEGGAEALIIDYSVAEGNPVWITEGITSEHQLQSEFSLIQVVFPPNTDTRDNENFKIRIRFDDVTTEDEETYRVTFNNIALDAVLIQ